MLFANYNNSLKFCKEERKGQQVWSRISFLGAVKMFQLVTPYHFDRLLNRVF